MFDTDLRRLKDRVGTPLARHMGAVSPIVLTLLALLAGLLASYAAYERSYPLAFGLWLLNRALDGLDGLTARLHGGQTDFGGYVDILTDFVVYAALPIGLVAGSPAEEPYLALAFMLAAFYVNSASWMYLAALLEKRAARQPDIQTSIVMPAGLIGGFETILAYGVFLLFPSYVTWLFSIFGLLVWITIIQRLLWARQALA